MANLYIGRDAVKRVAGINGAQYNTQVDRLIAAASRLIEDTTRRLFIPKTQTRTYRWPRRNSPGLILWLDEDLISVTTLQSEAQNSAPTTIAAADYFLEPANWGPPYNRIEIDLSSSAAFQSGDTPQRSISVAGSWGYSNATVSAGTVSSGLASSASATSMVCSSAALIDVGDTLLIESEQVQVTDRSFAALGAILLNGALTADIAEVTVTVDGSHGIVQYETIQVESERMFVESVSGNNLTVRRAYDGTVLASHANDTAVQINRTLTIARAQNGTTAATHADATAVSRYDPPADIKELCMAETIAAFHQETSGWGREVGTGEGAREFSGRDLARLRKDVTGSYKRMRSEAV